MADPDIDRIARASHDLERAHDVADEQRAEAIEEAEESRASRSFWRELPLLVAIALGVAVLLKVFVVQAFYIPSSSMEPTLEVDDRVAVSKLSYVLGSIDRGDVIVFDDPDGPPRDESVLRAVTRNIAEALGLSTPQSEFIKRVIAVAGDTVEIRDSRVSVNGVEVAEPYAQPAVLADYGPATVPADHVFVLGDNRAVSRDSRSFGFVPTDDIVGRAFSVIWPPSNFGGL